MKCSFCGKKEDEVDKLIAASNKIAICDNCVLDCVDILVYGEPDTITLDLGEDEEDSKDN